jgi:hypothetical protein
MTAYADDAEFLAALRLIIDAWCERRCLRALSYALPGFFALNGMTDGWGELREALGRVRSLAREELPADEVEIIADLIAAIDRAICGGRTSHAAS